MDNSGNINPLGFISNHVDNDGRISNSSSMDDHTNRFQRNNTRENGVRRGRSDDVAAAQMRELWMRPISGSREELINLKRAGPYAQMVIMQEIWHIAQQTNRITHLHQQTSSWGISPGFCTSNLSDPRVNYMEVSHSNLRTSTPNGTSGCGFNDGSLFKGYSQEVASRITPINRNMQGIERVVSKMNTYPEPPSRITVCSNGDVRSADKNSDSGSVLLQNSSQYIIQPSPGHHTKLQPSNHGLFENSHKVHLSKGTAQLNISISQEKPQSISESSDYPEVVMTIPISSEASNSKIQSPRSQPIVNGTQKPPGQITELQPKSVFPRQSDELCNQRARVKLPQLPEQINGLRKRMPETSAISSNLTQWRKFLYRYHCYRSKSGNMHNKSISFLSIVHKKLCVDPQCKCELFSRMVSHYDECTDPNCQLCVPVRKLVDNAENSKESRKRKNDTASAFCNVEINGAVADQSKQILPSSKCQKLEIFISSSDKTTRNQPHGSHQLPMKELLSNTDDQTVGSVNRCGTIDNRKNSNQNNVPFLENSIAIEATNVAVGTYQGFTSDGLPENSEKSGRGHENEAIEVRSMPGIVDTENKQDLLAFASNYEAKMKSKEHKILGVSLTEFFTAGELKEHLRSFGQWIGQKVGFDPSLCQNKCQLCAMDKLEFAPAPMYCSCCRSPIKHDLNYYQAFDETGAKHCFCTSCHRMSRKTILSFPKAKLQKEKNNLKNEESWVLCDKCEGWQHQICALYNDKKDPGGKAVYICPKCWLQELETAEGQPLSKTASLYARDLPRSMLSDHIEKRLFKRLRKEREEIAKDLSMNLGEVPDEAEFAVRVVLSVDKNLEVNKKFLDIFNESNYPAEFPYKSKVILLFQRIEGVDVCLFAMYVQEFGTNCDQPNQRCVYISYIDSIKYLRPEMKTVNGEALRTLVYHEILMGYLDYCKKRGFSTCYIWACPPLKGEDYILYCHPKSQKIPKADKLQQWYELMLKKAVKENIAVNCTNFYDHFFLSRGGYTTKTAARLPYFDGAYWSSTAESIIGTFEQDGKEPKLTKATLKAMGHSTSSTDAIRKDVLVMEKLGDSISRDKKKFIIVNLQHSCIRCNEAISSGVRWFCNKCKKFNICSRCLNKEQNLDGNKIHISNSGEKHILSEMVVNDVPCDTEDNDVTVDNKIFACRETFLSFCQRNHYQFDTLRRAKHSSMMILYHLHNSDSVDM